MVPGGGRKGRERRGPHATLGPVSTPQSAPTPLATIRAVTAEVTAEARARPERDLAFPRDYVEKVRAATAALAVSDETDASVRHAALLLEAQSAIDVNVPVAGGSRARRLVKTGAKRFVGWYLRYVGEQVSALGRSAATLGLAVADRVEQLDARNARLESEVARLTARVHELEAAAPDRPGDAGSSPR